MTALEAARLAEHATAVQRHVRRVQERLPEDPADLDLARLHETARHGPDDLLAFLSALRRHAEAQRES